MTLLANHPLTSTFATVNTLQSNGNNTAGASAPTGVAGHFEFVDGAAKVTVKESDVDTFGGKRSEMTFSHSLDPTGERWYTWDFMVESGWDFDTGMAIMQIHETPNTGAAETAVQFVLLLENGQLVPRVPTDVLVAGTSSYRSGNHPFEFDHWYSMCLHANWQLNTTGFWEMFVDGTPIFKRYGFANAYDFAVGAYLKLGIYNYNSATGWGTKSIFVRDVSVWSGNDGYQAVMGGVPTIPRRLTQV